MNTEPINNNNVTSENSFQILEVEGEMDCLEPTPTITEGEQNVQRKRPRGEVSPETEEGFMRVSRRRHEPEDKFQVAVTSGNSALPKQFTLARMFRDYKVNGVTRVRYVHQYKMLITFDNEENSNKFIQCRTFTEMGWRCQKTSEVGISYGIIKNVELDLSDEDILKNLYCDVLIVSAKRLNKRNYNLSGNNTENWIKSESIRLGFRGASIPTHVYIDNLKINVERYIFPVSQCSKCWKFGHTLRMCPARKIVCPKCSKNHENCDTTSYTCVNCAGNHLALQKICPVFKKERRIREIMSEFNCTYRKALTMYVPPSPMPEPVPSKNAEATYDMSHAHASSSFMSTPNRRLMSDLFKTPTRESPKSDNPPEPKRQKKRREHLQSTHSIDILHDTGEQSASTYTEHVTDSTYSSDDPPKHTNMSFIRLIIRLKNIITSRESIQNKILQVITISTNWLITFISNNISLNSVFESFLNNG